MPNLIERINAARGITNTVHPLIEENRIREAKTREADYASISIETRPLVPGCWNMEKCRQLVAEYSKTHKL